MRLTKRNKELLKQVPLRFWTNEELLKMKKSVNTSADLLYEIKLEMTNRGLK